MNSQTADQSATSPHQNGGQATIFDATYGLSKAGEFPEPDLITLILRSPEEGAQPEPQNDDDRDHPECEKQPPPSPSESGTMGRLRITAPSVLHGAVAPIELDLMTRREGVPLH